MQKYTNTETFNATAPLKVDSVRLKWIDDNDPDLSFLEQDYNDCSPRDRAKYQKQDKARLASYGQEWTMQGCVAVCIVSRPIGQGSRRLQEFQSSGLWGIESDSDASYLRQVEDEQLADLAEHLGAFGIKVTAETLRGMI